MKTDTIKGITVIYAEDGKAIRHKDGSDGESTSITEAWLGPSDSVDNWEDCEYHSSSLEMTMPEPKPIDA